MLDTYFTDDTTTDITVIEGSYVYKIHRDYMAVITTDEGSDIGISDTISEDNTLSDTPCTDSGIGDKSVKEHSSNSVLCDIGENQVLKIFKDALPRYAVERVGNVAHSGDILCRSIDKPTIMVEVKNKLAITQEDMRKFIADHERVSDISFFISIKANIPYYDKIYIDYDKRVVFMTIEFCESSMIQCILEIFGKISAPVIESRPLLDDYTIQVAELIMKEHNDLVAEIDMLESLSKSTNEAALLYRTRLATISIKRKLLTALYTRATQELESREVVNTTEDDEKIKTYLRTVVKSKRTLKSMRDILKGTIYDEETCTMKFSELMEWMEKFKAEIFSK